MIEKPYRDLNSFLKDKFKEKVYKVSIDAGLKCPNLDGFNSAVGCSFCDNNSLKPTGYWRGINLKDQLQKGIDYIRKRHNTNKFIAYLQPYSNTYGKVSKLKEIYETLIDHEDVVGLAISTRPDCVDDDKLDLIKEINQKKFVWIEYGLQSVFDVTLRKINRGHDYNDFLTAFNGAKKRGIPVCAHVIFGLPGETKDMMLKTVKTLSDLGIFGIKIHSLHVIRNTKMYEDYMRKRIELIPLKEYVKLVADALEIIHPNVVIHRLTGEGPKDITVAPEWIFNKMEVVNEIINEMNRRGSHQGSKLTDLGKIERSL